MYKARCCWRLSACGLVDEVATTALKKYNQYCEPIRKTISQSMSFFCQSNSMPTPPKLDTDTQIVFDSETVKRLEVTKSACNLTTKIFRPTRLHYAVPCSTGLNQRLSILFVLCTACKKKSISLSFPSYRCFTILSGFEKAPIFLF